MEKIRVDDRIVFQALLAILLVGRLVAFPIPVYAATSVVGTGSPGSCSEAAFDSAFYAVQAAGGTITFNCGPAPVIILFSTLKTVSANTVLEGGDLVTLSGANATGLFQVFSNQALTLNHIILTRGQSNAGAVENFGTLNINNSQVLNSSSTNSGGGVQNHNNLVLNNAVISGNSSAQYGGGIYTDGGTTTITNSQVTGNSAVLGGGAIAATTGASLVINSSSFSGNRATDTFAQGGALVSLDPAANTQITGSTFHQNNSSRGGAVSVLNGQVTISQSVFTGNWAAYGGAIRQEGGTLTLNRARLTGNGYATNGARVTTGGGALSWGNGTAVLNQVTINGNWASYGGGFDHENGTTTLTNVTVSGNQAVGSGGFDMNGGTVGLVNVTIANNSAGFFGGGIGNRQGTLTLKNTLLAGNLNTNNNAAWNCYKSVGSTPYNLSSDFTCGLGTGRDGVNPLIIPLQSVDTYTQVHPISNTSPAVDAGTGLGCPTTDQRGVTRPQGTACDIGAVEVNLGAGELFYHTYLPSVHH